MPVFIIDIVFEFFAAVLRGDRSWRPFLAGVAACALLAFIVAAIL